MLEKGREGIFQCGREITDEDLEEIQETVELFPKLSRTELALTVCENLGWMTASGSYKREACVKLLEKIGIRRRFSASEKTRNSGR